MFFGVVLDLYLTHIWAWLNRTRFVVLSVFEFRHVKFEAIQKLYVFGINPTLKTNRSIDITKNSIGSIFSQINGHFCPQWLARECYLLISLKSQGLIKFKTSLTKTGYGIYYLGQSRNALEEDESFGSKWKKGRWHSGIFKRDMIISQLLNVTLVVLVLFCLLFS